MGASVYPVPRYASPQYPGKRDVESFLTDLAVKRKVAPSTQNLALSSILFLYQKVLETELPWLDDVVRAKPRRRVPVVLSRNEVGCASADPVSALRSACSMVPVYGSWNVFACGSEM